LLRRTDEVQRPGQHQINALAADLLLTGAQAALKFLNVASTPSVSKEDREARYEEAFMIYTILKFLPRVPMNQEQKGSPHETTNGGAKQARSALCGAQQGCVR